MEETNRESCYPKLGGPPLKQRDYGTLYGRFKKGRALAPEEFPLETVMFYFTEFLVHYLELKNGLLLKGVFHETCV